MNERFFKKLESSRVLVGDGAMGTLLFEQGLKTGACPEKYNLTRPEIVKSIARDYYRAGADIIQTNTFGGTPLKLATYGLEDKTDEINRLAVEHVRSQIGENAHVSGSCGPTGHILKPYGDTEPEKVYESFKRQTRVLIDSGVDLICIETMTDISEAVLALKAVRDQNREIPVIATMTFDPTDNGFFTIMGVTVAEAVERLTEAGADLIGSNCGNGIEKMIQIAREFVAISDKPVVIQSNAGLPRLQNGEVIYPETAEFMAEKAQELIAMGVKVIGGCCGTGPDHIKAFRQVVDSIQVTG